MANSDLTIERAALGRVATIGDFYDARRDKFVHGNLFNKALPREYTTVHRENTVPSKVDFHLTTTTKEKMESMKLRGEIGVSFLCGMVAAEGSGGFLNEKRNNSKILDCVYSQNIRTEIERVNLNHDDISSFVKENSISSETTHIVVGIIRGCNTLVNLSCTVNEDTTQSSIKGQLKGEVEKFGKLAKSDLSQDAELTDDYKNHINDVKLTVFTDAAPAGGLTPRTIEEGFKIIEAISAKMTENSKERGVPITYELLSIKEVARILEKTFQLGGVFKTLDIRRIEELKNLLCEAEEQILRINEFSAETEKNKNFLPKERVQEIKKMQVDCEIYSPFLQQEVSRLLVASREDPKETEELIKLSSHFQGSQLSDDSMDSFFEKHEDVVEVFRFLEEMRRLKVTLVRASDEFRSIKRTKTATILFFSLKDISAAENLWNKATEVFLDICESQKKSEICAVVNTDRLSAIAQIEEIEDGPRIVKIEGRQYITKDLVGYQESAIGVSTVACTRNIETSRDVSKVLSPELLKGLTSDLVWQCLECFGRLTVDEDFPLLLNCGCGTRGISDFQYVGNSSINKTTFSYSTNNKLYMYFEKLTLDEAADVAQPTSFSDLFSQVAKSFEQAVRGKQNYFFHFNKRSEIIMVENFFSRHNTPGDKIVISLLDEGITEETLDDNRPTIEVSQMFSRSQFSPASYEIYVKLESELFYDPSLHNHWRVHKREWVTGDGLNNWEKISFEFQNYARGVREIVINCNTNNVKTGNTLVVVHSE